MRANELREAYEYAATLKGIIDELTGLIVAHDVAACALGRRAERQVRDRLLHVARVWRGAVESPCVRAPGGEA